MNVETKRKRGEVTLKGKEKHLHYLAIGLLSFTLFILLWDAWDIFRERTHLNSIQSDLDREVVALKEELNSLHESYDENQIEKLRDAATLAEEQLEQLYAEYDHLAEKILSALAEKADRSTNYNSFVSVEYIQAGLEALGVSDPLAYSIYLAGIPDCGYAENGDEGYYIVSTFGALIFLHHSPDDLIDHFYIVDDDNKGIILSEKVEMRL